MLLGQGHQVTREALRFGGGVALEVSGKATAVPGLGVSSTPGEVRPRGAGVTQSVASQKIDPQ